MWLFLPTTTARQTCANVCYANSFTHPGLTWRSTDPDGGTGDWRYDCGKTCKREINHWPEVKQDYYWMYGAYNERFSGPGGGDCQTHWDRNSWGYSFNAYSFMCCRCYNPNHDSSA